MPQVTPKYCEDHRTPFLGKCPFCEAGLEPVRFMEARADFAGLPLAGTYDILPHYQVVSLEDVLAVLGHQLAGLERLQAEVLRPYDEAKKVIYAHMRQAYIDPKTMQQAVRIHLGAPGSEHAAHVPAVRALVDMLRRGIPQG